MNKKEQIKTDMIKAMKEKDKLVKDSLSFLLGQIKNAEIEKRSELTEQELDKVILKEVKQIQETISSITPEVASGRPELIEQNVARLDAVSKYAPRMMDSSEIRRFIYTVLGELNIEEPKKTDKSAIMKVLMPKVKGKADGKQVDEILNSILQ